MKIEKLTSLVRLPFCMLCLLLLGCGGGGVDMGQVAGRVTLEGKPVPGLIVVFHPQARNDGVNAATRQAMGETDAEGQYRLGTNAPGDGAAVGKHRVELLPADRESRLPGILAADFVADVQPGSNAIDLQLQPVGRR